ncbi:MAG: YncE family protein, partial [Ginsengibacter sp.]
MKTFKHQLPRIFFSINAFLLAFIFLSFSCNAQPTPKRSLIALSKGEHVLVIVDPSTLKTIARISVGEDPHEVIASSDGKTAFISIYGGGAFHELNVIDLINHKPLTNVDTRPLFGPHGITFVDGKVWFSAEGSKAVGRYDPATAKLDWSMGTGQDRTHMIYVSEDGQKVYTTNISSGTVSILLAPESQTAGRHGNWTHAVVPTAVGSEGFDVSIDGKELWTASSNDGTISIIDLPTKKISAKIDAKVFGANRLVFTPDGKQVFISS